MTDFAFLLVLTGLWCFGIYGASQRGFLLYRLFVRPCERLMAGFGTYGQRAYAVELWRYYMKPIYGCTRCMASVWGTASFLAFGLNMGLSLPLLIPFVFCLSGLNYLIQTHLLHESA